MVAAAIQKPVEVMFLPRHATSWGRMKQQAETLRDAPGVRPVILIANAFMAGKVEECRDLGFEALELHDEIERRLRTGAPWLERTTRRLHDWLARHDLLANRLPFCLVSMLHVGWRLTVEYERFREVCAARRPTAIIVPGDRELSPVPAMLRAGLDLDIPTMIGFSGVPFADGGVEHARAFANRFKVTLGDLPPLLNLLAARRHPRQIRMTRNGPRLFSPGWLTLTLARKGMLSANPWVQGMGNCRYLLQHNRRFAAYFTERGLPETKSVLIGDATLDRLHAACRKREETRTELDRLLGSTPGQHLVALAMPNDYEHNLCDFETHLARMHRFLSRLARPDLKVVISLHPKQERSAYQDLAERYGFAFADRDLTALVPAADLFICGCSSTIMFAKLAAIPSINLDHFGHRDEDFESVPGLANVQTPDAFSAALDAFCQGNGPEGRDALQRFADALAEESLFDGRSGERFVSFIRSLVEAEAPAYEPSEVDSPVARSIAV